MQPSRTPKKMKRTISGGSSASGSIRVDRQLIRPSARIPWSVDVVSAVPKDIVGKLGEATTGASCHGWCCLGYKDGNFVVWQQRPKNLSETLEAPKGYSAIYIPDLSTKNDSSPVPTLVSLTPTPDGESVHLYTAHPESGWLVLGKTSRRDLANKSAGPRTYTAKVRIPLERPLDSAVPASNTERITSLTGSPDGYVVVGTSMGNLFYVTHTSVPPALHSQKVSVTKGILDYFFSYPGSGSSSPIKCVIPKSQTEFISISVEGTAVKWMVTATIGAGHHANFEPILLGSITSGDSILDFDQPAVLRATLSADKRSIHWIVRGSQREQGGSSEALRLYWIETEFSDGSLTVERCHWLSRFADPDRVSIVGLAASGNENTYAAFSSLGGGPVIVMILLKDCNIIQELDLPLAQIPSLLPSIFFKDVVTHGCCTIATSGIGIRVRYKPVVQEAANRRMGTAGQSFSSISSPSEVQKLASHLRSAFQVYYADPEMDLRMPPSLSQAVPADLEEAIVSYCNELQSEGNASSSSQNPLELHRALIKLLQDGSLYRSLSVAGRWKLFSIGQELAVFFELNQTYSKKKGSWEQEQMSSLRSHKICDWLLQLQSDQVDGGWEFAEPWSKLLCLCLEAAAAYREAWASTFYDLSEVPPRDEVCIWTSHRSLQTVLLQQMQYWNQDPSSRADLKAVETVVKAALLSYSESFIRIRYDEATKEYCKIKGIAIPLLRKVNGGDDDLAFELSTEHRYFDGLCKIAVDHEKKWDAKSFSLDPLFATLKGSEAETGKSFAAFVLQWHTDAGLFGHAINYGRHSPADLDLLMKKDDRLRAYRWIPAIRQYEYSLATESCLANTTELRDATLGSNLWTLSVAKLTTKLEQTRSGTVVKRQKYIERKVSRLYRGKLLICVAV